MHIKLVEKVHKYIHLHFLLIYPSEPVFMENARLEKLSTFNTIKKINLIHY